MVGPPLFDAIWAFPSFCIGCPPPHFENRSYAGAMGRGVDPPPLWESQVVDPPPFRNFWVRLWSMISDPPSHTYMHIYDRADAQFGQSTVTFNGSNGATPPPKKNLDPSWISMVGIITAVEIEGKGSRKLIVGQPPVHLLSDKYCCLNIG